MSIMSGGIGTGKNRIEEEWKLVDVLVSSAKAGQWDKVFEILKKVPHVINIIPENRRWGILHQAVWWNKPLILKRVLMSLGCDPSLKSKTCTSEKGQTEGENAEKIAEMFGYQEMVHVLKNFELKPHAIVDENITCALYDTALMDKGLISIGLAGFKNTFHPSPIQKSQPVIVVLGNVFKTMCSSDACWMRIRDQVCDTLNVVNKDAMESIKASSSTRENFFQSIICDYTREETYMYDFANTALRMQTETNYVPSAEDLALAPYIIVYTMLLLFWPELKRESATTYRRVLLSKGQIDQYQVGRRFTWLGFVSSSMVFEKAIPFPTCTAQGDNVAMFIIDNSTTSQWQPRNIEQFAKYQERERVYPCGARFIVTGRKQQKETLFISLKLIN